MWIHTWNCTLLQFLKNVFYTGITICTHVIAHCLFCSWWLNWLESRHDLCIVSCLISELRTTNLAAVCWTSFRWCPPVNRSQPGSLSLHRIGPVCLTERWSPPLCAAEVELRCTETCGRRGLYRTTVLSPTVRAWKQRHGQPYYATIYKRLNVVFGQVSTGTCVYCCTVT